MKTYTRDEIKQRITHETDNGRALVIGNAGLGMTAKFIERGGADFLRQHRINTKIRIIQ